MAWNEKLIRRISKTDSSDVMHSSGIGKAQNADSFGTIGSSNYANGRRSNSPNKYLRGYANTSASMGLDNSLAQRRLAREEAEQKKDTGVAQQKTEYQTPFDRIDNRWDNSEPKNTTRRLKFERGADNTGQIESRLRFERKAPEPTAPKTFSRPGTISERTRNGFKPDFMK